MVDSHDDYLAHLDEALGQDARREGFCIADDAMADWAVRKIARAQEAMRRRAEFVEAEIQRLRQWQQERDAQDQDTIEFFQGHLARYFDDLRRAGMLGKRKSYRLPHGTLQVRAAGPRWRRIDDDALVAWAKSVHPQLVRVKEEPAWGDIAKRLRPASDAPGAPAVDVATGEVVPGVVLDKPAGEEFSVRVADAGVTGDGIRPGDQAAG